MKKLSLLIALALCVTIGGVWATWSYSEQNAVNEEALNFSVSLEKYEAGAGAKGSLTTIENTLKMVVDDTGAVDYVADLVYTGRIVILFSAYDNALVQYPTLADTGIPVEFTISSTLSHNGQPMFIYPNTGVSVTMTKVTAENATTLVSGLDLSEHVGHVDFVGVVDGATLEAAGFDLNNITLPDLFTYHAFQDDLKTGTVTLAFNEKLS